MYVILRVKNSHVNLLKLFTDKDTLPVVSVLYLVKVVGPFTGREGNVV